jgi:hypothetical protein
MNESIEEKSNRLRKTCTFLYKFLESLVNPNTIHQHDINETMQNIKSYLKTIHELMVFLYELKSNSGKTPLSLVSLNHMKGIYTSLEMCWYCDIVPCLNLNFDSNTIYPKSLLVNESEMKVLSNQAFSVIGTSSSTLSDRVLESLNIIHDIATLNAFRPMMIERSIDRIYISIILLRGMRTMTIGETE